MTVEQVEPRTGGKAGRTTATGAGKDIRARRGLLLGRHAAFRRRLFSWAGRSILFLVTAASASAVMFIFFYVVKEAIPFFLQCGVSEFLLSTRWYPSREPPEFGALAIFFGSAMVSLGAALFAVPVGVAAAVCLSDILPFKVRQAIKPAIEILAAIPSVAYGFFALVVFAPLLQEQGGKVLAAATLLLLVPLAILASLAAGGMAAPRLLPGNPRFGRYALTAAFAAAGVGAAWWLSGSLAKIEISSGTNALNVSIILGIMALPTVISVSEDALQAVGRELREASYALGATRAETIIRVVMPAAASGILAAVLMGFMRAIGETMVVWMASGNSAKIPSPFYNYLEPVRTLTATIAGDMGEADHVTGSARYHVLFAMAASLLAISLACNAASEWIARRARRKMAGE
ncbi:MAG: phosphate ABC transporter permease subunit PstC [Planctomycetota bacterium]|nr:phosphate ABC transporter permease subunit PstC [Planctomycetota bacterium]